MKLNKAGTATAGLAAVLMLCAGCASTPFLLTEVSPGIFEGSKPRTQADFDALRQHGIRTILSLQQMPWDTYPEHRRTKKNGLAYRNVPILASPLEPGEKSVEETLQILEHPSLRPIFVHCLLGRDRCTFIIGLYRMYYEDWTSQEAWSEMLRSGFHVRLTLRGFRTYFWKHTKKPEWVANPAKSNTALPIQ